MKLEEFWQQKSDRELQIAGMEIAEYEEPAQQVIRAEIRRRKLPEPPSLMRTEADRKPQLLGNQVEKLKLSHPENDGWVRWLIGVPLALIAGGLLVASATPRNLLIGGVIIGGIIWSLIKAIEERNDFLVLYERGLVHECPKPMRSAYYDELVVEKTIFQTRFLWITLRTDYLYTLKFPNGDRVSLVEPHIGEKLQNIVIQHRSPQMLDGRSG